MGRSGFDHVRTLVSEGNYQGSITPSRQGIRTRPSAALLLAQLAHRLRLGARQAAVVPRPRCWSFPKGLAHESTARATSLWKSGPRRECSKAPRTGNVGDVDPSAADRPVRGPRQRYLRTPPRLGYLYYAFIFEAAVLSTGTRSIII
jgi:hypothetical protein